MIPARIRISGKLPLGLDIVCRDLGITLEMTETPLPLVQTIEATWNQYPTAVNTVQQFRQIFDTYLLQQHGFSPLRTKRQQDHTFGHLLGYNRDPAWQLPALRSLLPAHPATINQQGEVEFDGLHFQDDILTFFPTTAVTLRPSEHSEATAWIYLDGEILCEAKAHELRRADGTYRPRRPRGRSRFID